MWQQVTAPAFVDVVVEQEGLVDFAELDQPMPRASSATRGARRVAGVDRALRDETDQLRGSGGSRHAARPDRDVLLAAQARLDERRAIVAALVSISRRSSRTRQDAGSRRRTDRGPAERADGSTSPSRRWSRRNRTRAGGRRP